MLNKLFLINRQRLFSIFYAWLLAFILQFVGYVFFYGSFGASNQSIFFLLAVYLIPAYLVASLAYTALHMLGDRGDHDKHVHGH